jgi:hypothetical protein
MAGITNGPNDHRHLMLRGIDLHPHRRSVDGDGGGEEEGGDHEASAGHSLCSLPECSWAPWSCPPSPMSIPLISSEAMSRWKVGLDKSIAGHFDMSSGANSPAI